MKCLINTADKQEQNRIIVRRKFVPIKFTVQREGQFLNAGAKLPFATSKVNGLLVTSKVEDPCVDEGLPPKYYYGTSDTRMTDTRFLSDNQGSFYDGEYPPDGVFQAPFTGQWWYYVHRILDRFPIYIDNGLFQRLVDPVTIAFKQPGQCTPDQYYLWSGRLPGDGIAIVTFFPPN